MNESSKTLQGPSRGVAMPLVKALLVIAAVLLIAWSVVMIDIPNGRYYWIAFEVAIALILLPVAFSSLKQVFGGRG